MQLAKSSLATFACAVIASAPAAAQPPSAVLDSGSEAASPAAAAAGAGAFVAWTEHARTDRHRGMLAVHAGHATHLGWARSGLLEVVVLRPEAGEERRTGRDVGLALRASGFSRGGEDELFGELGAKAQLVFQSDAGFDLSAMLSYQDQGFNLRPALATGIIVGTDLGSTLVLGNALYGHGLADEERYGALRLVVLQRLSDELQAGLDSKLEMDLELDEDEPDGEPQLILHAGPAVTWTFGNIALSAQGGASVVRLRFQDPRGGAVALLGAGGAF